MTTLLQVSDPHFGTEREPIVQALLRLAGAQKPDVLLVTGDVTQRATPPQFAAARRFVERIDAGTRLVIPGNHDVPLFNVAARAFATYGRLQRAFGATLEPEYERADVLVLALNTTRAWRHKDGELSPRQVERVARRVERATPAQVRVVALHHPIAVTRPEDETHVLHGAAAAIRRWAAAGADVVLGGHIHLPYTIALHQRDAALPRALYAVQAGTAVSSRVRREAGNSVNLLRCRSDALSRLCTVERWDYAADGDAFVCTRTEDLALGPSHAGVPDA